MNNKAEELEVIKKDGFEYGWEGLRSCLKSWARQMAEEAVVIELSILRAEIERKDEALEATKQYIENGIEFGFIKQPEPPDSACETLPKIKQALSTEEKGSE